MNKNRKKQIILDTNIIIRDPSILNTWSPMIEFIVPDIIVNELSRLVQVERIPKDIIRNTLEKST